MSGDLEPYFEEDDEHGCVLAVHGYDGRAVVQVTDGPGEIRVVSWVADPLKAPDLCRAVFQAAGLEPPVMLGRPEVDPARPVTVGEFQVWKEASGSVGFMPADPGKAAVTGALRLEPYQVRALAAVAVAYADAKPDPAEVEVEELAGVIRLAIHPASERLGLRPTESDRTAARAALAWVRGREAGRG